jgi:heat shock protein HslJ
LLALAACDTMGPQQTPTSPPAMLTPEGGATVESVVPAAATPTVVGESAAPGSDLLGTTWEWVSVIDPAGQTTASDPTRYTITFNSDGTASIKADCNSVTATYTTDGASLSIIPGASTAAACPEDTQDQLFVNSLSSSSSYVVQDGELIVTLADGSGTMMFRAAGTGEAEAPTGDTLTGVTWEWIQSVTMLGTTDVADPTRYQITFNEDGTANIKADCNNVLANYTTDDSGGMTLTLGPSTLVACPPDSQVNQFLAELGVVGAYSFDNGDLVLRNVAADGGATRFRAAGAAMPEEPVTEAPTLIGTWEWVETVTPVETIVAADPSRYQITFAEDGTAGIVADCNVGNATYTTGEGGEITITLGVSTLAFCENSQDQIFRTHLAAASIYHFDGEDLLIDLFADGGTMRLRRPAEAGAAGAPTGDTLTGITWQWVESVTMLGTTAVADPTRYQIVFNDDGTANIKADCNSVMATYTTDDSDGMTITLGPSTLVACPPDSQVDQFLAELGAVGAYSFVDGDLVLRNVAADGGSTRLAAAGTTTEQPDQEGPAVLPPGPSDPLIGINWQLNLIEMRDGNITINDPTRYTLTLNDDGTANFQADCNVGGLSYTLAEGNLMTITLGPTTLAYCGAGSLDQIYLSSLSNAMGYRLEEGNLLIDMLDDAGSLIFSPAG